MLFVVVASLLAPKFVTAAPLYVEDEAHLDNLFLTFKKAFLRSYSNEAEEKERFAHFLVNLKLADKRNEENRLAGGEDVHGITKFSDRSPSELKAMFLNELPKVPPSAVYTQVNGNLNHSAGLVDWTGKYTTPVKNQGYCGSCWAFSGISQVESDSMRQLGTSYKLSTGQVTECAYNGCGCGGGWPDDVYKYIQRVGGVQPESSYPYTSGEKGVCQSCHPNPANYVVTTTNFAFISGEQNMATYVQQTGPVSVCVNANSWGTYTGGILQTCNDLDGHCAQVVGVDVGNYWKVRNSWGTDFGEKGYIRLAYGKNLCQIASHVTHVNTKKVSSPPVNKCETNCSWKGHCKGCPCTTYNDCDGDMTCKSGVCG